jgi:hypothetical protein
MGNRRRRAENGNRAAAADSGLPVLTVLPETI